MSNQDIWAEALKEAENPELRDAGLWAKSFAEADGDDAKSRAAYIKAKVNSASSRPEPTTSQMASDRGWCPVCHDRMDLDSRYCSSCNSSLSARGLSPLKYRPTGPSMLSQQAPSGTQGFQIVKTAKSRGIYILLALFFLGMLGAHNFYAGRYLRGALQLLCTCILGWFVIGLVITFIWVLIDLFTVTEDGDGVPLA